MISIFSILVSLVLAYFATSVYAFTCNLLAARASGLPYVIIPWDQNGFLWMIISVPLRPHLKRLLPSWLWDRTSLTIYGFEFHERLRLLNLMGGGGSSSSSSSSSSPAQSRSYILVSPGKFELSTMEPELAEQVMHRTRDFVPHDFTKLFMERFGPNVLTSEGETWSRQRRLVAGVINERISATVFAESVRQTRGLLAEVLSSGSDSGETTRLFDMMKKITINVLSGAGMGASVHWHDRETPKAGYRLTYIEGVKRVIDAVAGPIILPKWFLTNYPSFLPGYNFINDLSYALDEFPTHTKDMLEKERERNLAAGGHTRSNIMSQLLQAAEGEKGGKALSEEEMMGNLFIFTAAGFDTTANSLSYALVLLARYPEWQQWICEEIDSIMPASSSDDDNDETAQLEYAAIFPKATRVLALMLETLRLYSPVVHVAKMTRAPQTIQTSATTYHIPARATVYLNTICLHVDPHVWRNVNLAPAEQAAPDDELRFRPSRWINLPNNAGSSSSSGGGSSGSSGSSMPLFQPPKGSYIPWSGGPRVCPGQKMAQVEFVSIFLMLFWRHRIEAVPLPLAGGGGADGKLETRQQVEERLDRRLKDSISILTLQMVDVYNTTEGKGNGLNLRLVKR